MQKRAIALFVAAIMISLIPATGLAIEAYSQDFEGLNAADTGALTADGWLVFANVFGPGGDYWYGYGAFPAPNDGFAFCQVATGEGGGMQGAQQLVSFSDYNNADHGNGANIQSIVFQEQTVDAGNVGETWFFNFQAKMGNLEGASTAAAFIKTLNPAAGWATTNELTEDMTSTPAVWTDYAISIVITPDLVGQIFQIGFLNIATNYEGSGVFYDNIDLDITGPVATENETWGGVKSLFR